MREENTDTNEGVIGLGSQGVRGGSRLNDGHTEMEREEMCWLHRNTLGHDL